MEFTKGIPPPPLTSRGKMPAYKSSQYFPTKALYNSLGQSVSVGQVDVARVQDALLTSCFPCIMCRQSYHCPAQTNGYDCGVFVCIYVHELVATDFKHLEEGLPALTYGPGKFRNNLRDDLVHQAMGTLFGQLVREKCLVPDQDPPLTSSSNSPLP
ncbi:unnamed protein product [Closterium sp. NIES-54]